MKIFTVFDSKAEAYIQPFFAMTDGVALRMFQQAAGEEGHNFNLHAEDFTLFEIGDFDEMSGVIEPLKAIKGMGNALEAKTISHIQGMRTDFKAKQWDNGEEAKELSDGG